MKISYDCDYGSHLPITMKLINITFGPILECGIGFFSSPILHWSCYLTKRKLVSYEANESYYQSFESFKSDFHELYFVSNWEDVNVDGQWDVALLDQNPTRQRAEIARRIAQSAKFIILHDSQPEADRHFRYSRIYHLFKYRKDFTFSATHTTVLSNFCEVPEL